MSGDETTIEAPVEFGVGSDDTVILKFGPMSMDDLMETLANLATPEGHLNFLAHLNDAMKEAITRER